MIALILGREIHCISAHLPSRDNRDLVNRVIIFEIIGGDCVACLVIGGQALLLVGHLMALLLGARDDLYHRLFYLGHGDGFFIAARSEKSRFVEQILEVCAGKADSCFCNSRKIDIGAEGLALGVDFEDSLASFEVGIADCYLAVKSAGTQKRGVEDIGAVSRRDDYNALVCTEAVHLDEQLVQSLLTLIVSAAHACASVASDGVYLIDKDYRG